jgi:hypothetical protein
LSLLIGLDLTGVITTLLFSGGLWPTGQHGLWPVVYASILSSAWLLPVPFISIALLAFLQLSPALASPIVAFSIWIASLCGYSLARMFPTAAARYYNRISPHWLPKKMGQRRFEALISILADPRIDLRSKIAYQGLSSVPLPWFAFATWIVLPAVLVLGCRGITALAPTLLLASLQDHPASWLTAILSLSTARSVRSALSKGEPSRDGNS